VKMTIARLATAVRRLNEHLPNANWSDVAVGEILSGVIDAATRDDTPSEVLAILKFVCRRVQIYCAFEDNSFDESHLIGLDPPTGLPIDGS
jgi:hypothetical protein